MLLAFPGAGIVRAQDFYTQRLDAGKSEFAAERYGEAADDFRIAAFGMLNDPVRLSEALVRLAVADEAAKRTDDLKATLDRFLEIERRFPSYQKASLEPDIRAKFKELLLAHFPETVIGGIPSLTGLVPTPEQKILALPAKEQEGALEAKAKAEPARVTWPLDRARLAAAEGEDKSVIEWATRALQIEPTNEHALALRGHALVARKDYARARADLTALPPGRFDREPDLLSDLFVCDVELKDWDAAAPLEGKLGDKADARKDVRRARSDFQDHAAEERKAAEKRAEAEKKLAEKAAADKAAADKAATDKAAADKAAADKAAADKAAADKAAADKAAAEKAAEEKAAADKAAADKAAADKAAQNPAPPPAATAEIAPSVPVSSSAPPPPPTPAPAQPTSPAAPTLADARALVLGGKAPEAEKMLRGLVKAQPKRRELRLELLEAACLSKDWKVGVEQVSELEPFQTGEEPSLFYSAVVLWESGETGRARIYALRARGRITPSEYTEFYMKKILGSGQ
jgi:hypothetical protein